MNSYRCADDSRLASALPSYRAGSHGDGSCQRSLTRVIS